MGCRLGVSRPLLRDGPARQLLAVPFCVPDGSPRPPSTLAMPTSSASLSTAPGQWDSGPRCGSRCARPTCGMTGCRRGFVSFSRLNRSPARNLPVPGAGPCRDRGCREDQGRNDRTRAHRDEGCARFGLNVRSGNWGRGAEAKRFGHMVPAENFQIERVPAEYPDDAADPAQPPHRHCLQLSSLRTNPVDKSGRAPAHLCGLPGRLNSSPRMARHCTFGCTARRPCPMNSHPGGIRRNRLDGGGKQRVLSFRSAKSLPHCPQPSC